MESSQRLREEKDKKAGAKEEDLKDSTSRKRLERMESSQRLRDDKKASGSGGKRDDEAKGGDHHGSKLHRHETKRLPREERDKGADDKDEKKEKDKDAKDKACTRLPRSQRFI